MDLENLAIDWVKRCMFAHPDPKEFPQYRGIGQNLAITGGSHRSLTAMAARWYGEVEDYHYDTNSCNEGKLCGHYTQVRWLI